MKKTLKLKDDAILIKNTQDLFKADMLLRSIGIGIFSDDAKRKQYEKKDVNGFLIKDQDGYRIQSHYIGFGTPVDVLEVKIQKYKSKQNTLFTEEEILDTAALVSEKVRARQSAVRELAAKIAVLSDKIVTDPQNAQKYNSEIHVHCNDISKENEAIAELLAELKIQKA
jgi:hypothetical protein